MGLIKRNDSETVYIDERTSERDFNGLLKALEDSRPAARRWAARDLGVYPQAAQVLVQHLESEKDASVREAIITSLVRLATPDAIFGLIELLRSDDAFLRNEAISALKLLPHQVAINIPSLLSDPDSDFRIFVVNILESLRHPMVESWLLDLLKNETHPNVCSAALDLLGEVGSPAAVPVLRGIRMRFVNEPYIQFAVDLALSRIDGS